MKITKKEQCRFKTASAWELEVEIDEVIIQYCSLFWFYCFDFKVIFERHE